mgnify:CR=1 FL=1
MNFFDNHNLFLFSKYFNFVSVSLIVCLYSTIFYVDNFQYNFEQLQGEV